MRIILAAVLTVLICLSLASCGSSSNNAPTCTISGTLTFINTGSFAVVVSGLTYTFMIDTDTTFNNGNEAAKFHGTWSTGTTVNYSFDITSVTAGQYYLYSDVYPIGYMIYGWYGGTVTNAFNPRVKVPVACGAKYDFFVDVT
jgi:hypothetical protein